MIGGQNTGVQELQEFRSRKLWREDSKDSCLLSKASSNKLFDREDNGLGVHSATPELLNSCNSSDYVRI